MPDPDPSSIRLARFLIAFACCLLHCSSLEISSSAGPEDIAAGCDLPSRWQASMPGRRRLVAVVASPALEMPGVVVKALVAMRLPIRLDTELDC